MDFLSLVAKLSLDSSEYESGLNKAKGLASGIGGAIGTGLKVAGAAIAGATTAVVGFAASSVSAGKDFDSSMSQVAATMGKTMSEMDNEVGSVTLKLNGQTKEFSGTLREFAQEMGANTAFSATQAGEALNYMALAGYDTQTSMSMLPNVLNLAAAGSMDLARASDMVTDTQTAFGMTLERTSQMVDEMAKASSTGNTSVEQLGDAFLTVGGLAQELNGGMVTLADGTQKPVDGIQELEIALTAMANAGVKGSEAGTHMRNMLLKLSSPTDEGTAALEEMGVAVFDTEGKMRSLSDIFGDLSNELDNMTQEQKIQTISDLFNTRDLASAEALLKAVGQDWDKIGASILDADGAAQQMADTQLDNLEGDITKFKSALEGAQIVVSDGLTPELRKFVQFGTDGLSTLTSAFKEGGLSGVMSAFGGVLADGIGMITEMLPNAVDAGIQLLEAVGKGLIDNAPKIFDAVTEIGGMVLEKSADIMQKIADGLAEFDYASAVGRIVDVIVEFLTGDSATKMMEAGVEIIGSLLNGFVQAIPELVQGAAEILTSLGEGIKTGLPEFVQMASDVLVDFTAGLSENAGTLIDAGVDLLMGLADGIITSLPILIENIPKIITNVVQAFAENAPKLMESGGELIAKLVLGIIQAIPSLLAAIPQLIKAIFDAWRATNFLELGIHLIKGIINGLASAAPQFLKSIVDMAKKAMDAFKKVDWLSLGTHLIKTIVKGVASVVTLLPKALVDMAKKAMDAFKKVDWLSLGKNIIDGVVKGVGDTASKLIDAMVNLAKNAWSAVKKFFGIESPSKLMRDTIGANIGKGMAIGIEKSASDVQDAMDDLTDIVETPNVTATIDVNKNGLKNGFANTDDVLASMENVQNENKELTIILELDKNQFAKAVYQLNNEETQRVGLKLAGGLA